MRIKDSTVSIKGLSNEILLSLIIIDGVMRENGQEAVITSGSEETTRHGESSLHYSGNAADIRSRAFASPEIVLALCIEALGSNPDIDMIYHRNHFHIEFQPKRKDALL